MTPQIRLRHHPDGSFAIGLHGTLWLTCVTPDLTQLSACGDTRECSGPGWSELFVAELPEPDGWADAVGDNGQDSTTLYWEPGYGGSITAWIDGVETPEMGLEPKLEQLRSDALRMLAAVAACEQYRAEREAVT